MVHARRNVSFCAVIAFDWSRRMHFMRAWTQFPSRILLHWVASEKKKWGEKHGFEKLVRMAVGKHLNLAHTWTTSTKKFIVFRRGVFIKFSYHAGHGPKNSNKLQAPKSPLQFFVRVQIFSMWVILWAEAEPCLGGFDIKVTNWIPAMVILH